MTAKEIIDALGGVMQLARDLNAPFTTVSSWARNNFIPEWRKDALLSRARAMGVDLATSDFPTEEDRVDPKAAA